MYFGNRITAKAHFNIVDGDRFLAQWHVLVWERVKSGRVDVVKQVNDQALPVLALAHRNGMHTHRRLDRNWRRPARRPRDGLLQEQTLVRIGIEVISGIESSREV